MMRIAVLRHSVKGVNPLSTRDVWEERVRKLNNPKTNKSKTAVALFWRYCAVPTTIYNNTQLKEQQKCMRLNGVHVHTNIHTHNRIINITRRKNAMHYVERVTYG